MMILKDWPGRLHPCYKSEIIIFDFSGLHMALDFPIKVSLFPGSSAVEQLTVNQLAGGSNPSRGAIFPSITV